MFDNIVFFDGVCGLCNSSVDFLIKADKKRKLRFSPLQGNLAKSTLPTKITDNLNSIVFFQNKTIYTESTAIIKIAITMGGIWKIFAIFLYIPHKWRNYIYKYIAKNRYKWFGVKESCRIPSKEERALFVD